jgi:hypothetical protein
MSGHVSLLPAEWKVPTSKYKTHKTGKTVRPPPPPPPPPPPRPPGGGGGGGPPPQASERGRVAVHVRAGAAVCEYGLASEAKTAPRPRTCNQGEAVVRVVLLACKPVGVRRAGRPQRPSS